MLWNLRLKAPRPSAAAVSWLGRRDLVAQRIGGGHPYLHTVGRHSRFIHLCNVKGHAIPLRKLLNSNLRIIDSRAREDLPAQESSWAFVRLRTTYRPADRPLDRLS